MKTFQKLIATLNQFWADQGCIVQQGYDLEVGAGTFNPATFLRCLGPEPYYAAYVEPSRRPTDGRYGKNPNRVQHFFQYQVILKPSPLDIQQKYLQSLKAIGFDLEKHDIRFVHDDWASPTLGAWGLGWEIWIDGMEVSQFTYFQNVGGIPLSPITGEITYGLERLAMYIQNVDSIYDLKWNDDVNYGDIYHQSEIEWSHYNFDQANTKMWFSHFDDFEVEALRLIEAKLVFPAYDFVMKASHAFNLLDARGVISVTERTGYIARIRQLSMQIAQNYTAKRKEQSYPLLKNKTPLSELLEPKITASSFNPEKQRDFVLEIGSEELPATFIPIGSKNLKTSVKALLDEHELTYETISAYGSPRRLVVYIKNLIEGKPKQLTQRKGPPVKAAFDQTGKATKVGIGFLKSLNIQELALDAVKDHPDLKIVPFKGSDYLMADVHIPAVATTDILSRFLPKLIIDLEFPKKMRWSDLTISYARPLKWILALFGKEQLSFQVGPITSSNTSMGHAQLCPKIIHIHTPENYIDDLRKVNVLVDDAERIQSIERQLETIEKEAFAKVVKKEDVLAEVAYLSEWPQLLLASFDKRYLKAPKEVLISEMVEHQRYFPLSDEHGHLTNSFIITADNKGSDQIRLGNLKALSPRLSDGLFLYEQDVKTPLIQFVNRLKDITYQKSLGTLYDKTERLMAFVEILSKYHQTLPLQHAKRAAELAKADLATGLVYEFPELQGIAGKYYATAQGEDHEVAQAIEEHWLPRHENDKLPSSESGTALALADKIDNLITCFTAGFKPSSSSDPYALRRQVLGIIKILIAKQMHFPMKAFLNDCYDHFIQVTPHCPKHNKLDILQDIEQFILARIKTVFQTYDLKKDEIEAALSSGFTDIFEAFLKVQALNIFRSKPAFTSLFEVYKRAKGQLTGQEKVTFNPAALVETAEKHLNTQFDTLSPLFSKALQQRDYTQAYQVLSQLQTPLADLFDQVKILCDDESIRLNRLALLTKVFDCFNQLLDFSKIQVIHKR